MRWVIVAILILACGGFVALGGYAGFEFWRVGNVSTEMEAERLAPPPPVEAPPTPPECEAGLAAFAAKDYEGTTSLLEVCLDAVPDHAEARLARGRANAALGRYERADLDLSRGLALRPDVVEGWEALVYARSQNGDDRGAVTAADRWLAVQPGAARAIRMRADARYRMGELAEARDDAARACALGDADACELEKRMKAARKSQ